MSEEKAEYQTKHDPSEAVTRSDAVRDALRTLKDTSGLSWRKIALLRPYADDPPMPAGTLCAIAKGGKIPALYAARFGIVSYALTPVCPHCGVVHYKKTCPAHPARPRARVAVNTRDMRSAAQTLRRHLDPADLTELTDLLMAGHIR